jgi:hypothetical protein
VKNTRTRYSPRVKCNILLLRHIQYKKIFLSNGGWNYWGITCIHVWFKPGHYYNFKIRQIIYRNEQQGTIIEIHSEEGVTKITLSRNIPTVIIISLINLFICFSFAVYLSIYLPIYLSIYLWLYCPGVLWPLFQFLHTPGRTPWTSDHPVARPLHTHRITQTQNELTGTSYSNGIRTYKPSDLAGEGG